MQIINARDIKAALFLGNSQSFLHGCELKSGSGLGTRLALKYLQQFFFSEVGDTGHGMILSISIVYCVIHHNRPIA